RSIEEVAALLWLDDFARAESLFNVPDSFEALIDVGRADLPCVPRLIQVLARAGSEDLDAYWLSPDRVARTGARILRLMACVLAEKPSADRPVARPGCCPGAERRADPVRRSRVERFVLRGARGGFRRSAALCRRHCRAGRHPGLQAWREYGAGRGAAV